MSTFLRRVGGATAAHPWRTVGAWLLILVAVFALNAAFGGESRDNYNIPGTPSQAGTEFLRERMPELAGADARVVVHDPSGGDLDPAVLASLRDRLTALPGVSVVDAPRLSADGDTALLAVSYDVPVTDFKGSAGTDALDGAAAPARAAGLQVELGGSVPENVSAPNGVAEAGRHRGRAGDPGARARHDRRRRAAARRRAGRPRCRHRDHRAALRRHRHQRHRADDRDDGRPRCRHRLRAAARRAARGRSAARAVGPGRGRRGHRDRRASRSSWPA